MSVELFIVIFIPIDLFDNVADMTVYIGNITTVASAVANQKKAAYFLLAVSLATVAILPTNCHGCDIIGKVY